MMCQSNNMPPVATVSFVPSSSSNYCCLSPSASHITMQNETLSSSTTMRRVDHNSRQTQQHQQRFGGRVIDEKRNASWDEITDPINYNMNLEAPSSLPQFHHASLRRDSLSLRASPARTSPLDSITSSPRSLLSIQSSFRSSFTRSSPSVQSTQLSLFGDEYSMTCLHAEDVVSATSIGRELLRRCWEE